MGTSHILNKFIAPSYVILPVNPDNRSIIFLHTLKL